MKNIKPIVERILSRQGKKGPFEDGEKMALVLLGGTMAGVNGAGAMIALQQLGLSHAFDAIFTASAGFPNASYLLAEDTEAGASIYYEELAEDRFINFWRFYKPINFEAVFDAIKNKKPLQYQKIWQSNSKLHLRMRSMETDKKMYIIAQSVDNFMYYDLLRASISFPILTKGFPIDGVRYCDGQITNNDICEHIFHALCYTSFSSIVIIY